MHPNPINRSPDDDGTGAPVPTSVLHFPRPLRLQVISDLDFESRPLAFPRLAAGVDAVVVAGDTCEGSEKAFAFLRAAFPHPTPILAVLGNRAFHGRALIPELNRARIVAPTYGVTLLEDRMAVVGGVRFIGSTMWTGYDLDGGAGQVEAMGVAARTMEDHRRILLVSSPTKVPFTPKHALALFQGSTAYILKVLGHHWIGPTVVVTHHAPSALSLDPMREDRTLDGAYASRLDAMVGRSGASLWTHGHVVSSCDYRLGGTRVLCNPRGGEIANPDFNPGLVVEVAR